MRVSPLTSVGVGLIPNDHEWSLSFSKYGPTCEWIWIRVLVRLALLQANMVQFIIATIQHSHFQHANWSKLSSCNRVWLWDVGFVWTPYTRDANPHGSKPRTIFAWSPIWWSTIFHTALIMKSSRRDGVNCMCMPIAHAAAPREHQQLLTYFHRGK